MFQRESSLPPSLCRRFLFGGGFLLCRNFLFCDLPFRNFLFPNLLFRCLLPGRSLLLFLCCGQQNHPLSEFCDLTDLSCIERCHRFPQPSDVSYSFSKKTSILFLYVKNFLCVRVCDCLSQKKCVACQEMFYVHLKIQTNFSFSMNRNVMSPCLTMRCSPCLPSSP